LDEFLQAANVKLRGRALNPKSLDKKLNFPEPVTFKNAAQLARSLSSDWFGLEI